VVVAARLTDKQKKKIIADYVELGSYNAVAKKNKVSKDSVRRTVMNSNDFAQKAQHKKEENTADILSYMDRQKERVCDIIDIALETLPEKIINARTASEVTTALGTLIDKFAPRDKYGKDEYKNSDDDPITKALKEGYKDELL
jgi:hypothetical protein